MQSLQAEMQEVKSRFLTELTALVPELGPAAASLLQRIGASNWTLEWGLPYWLGITFGLSAEAMQHTMLFNAFGLGFVRLTDDLADGESPWPEPTPPVTRQPEAATAAQQPNSATPASSTPGLTRSDAVLLQVALQHLASRQITRLADSIRTRQGPGLAGADAAAASVGHLLHCFDLYMGQWLRATSDRSPSPPACLQAYAATDFVRLAERGALLKLCCAAACCMAGRPGDLDTVTSMIDALLVGCVLLDHMYDWAEDIAAGRYNAFVAYCSNLPQCEAHRMAHQEAVIKKLYLDDAGASYLALVHQYLEKAQSIAVSIGCAGLGEFISVLNAEIAHYGNALTAAVQRQLESINLPVAQMEA